MWRAHKEIIGFTIVLLGSMCGDSENLLIPLSIIAVGIAIMRIGAVRNE